MTVQDIRTVVETPAIPRPRTAEPEIVPTLIALPDAPVMGEYPWPEPWHYSRAERPRSEYWDVATASWHSRGPRLHTDER